MFKQKWACTQIQKEFSFSVLIFTIVEKVALSTDCSNKSGRENTHLLMHIHRNWRYTLKCGFVHVVATIYLAETPQYAMSFKGKWRLHISR